MTQIEVLWTPISTQLGFEPMTSRSRIWIVHLIPWDAHLNHWAMSHHQLGPVPHRYILSEANSSCYLLPNLYPRSIKLFLKIYTIYQAHYLCWLLYLVSMLDVNKGHQNLRLLLKASVVLLLTCTRWTSSGYISHSRDQLILLSKNHCGRTWTMLLCNMSHVNYGTSGSWVLLLVPNIR